jgi:uncharacterized protein YndB with AHSA1/START domain
MTMREGAMSPLTHDIVVEEIIEQPIEKIWRALTSADLIAQWLMPNDFAAKVGHGFTFKTAPMGDWDGIVHCEVLEVSPPRRLVYSWRGGAQRAPGMLDTIVIWTLREVEGGVLLRLVHAGFQAPENDSAFKAMSPGWGRIAARIGAIAAGLS